VDVEVVVLAQVVEIS